MGKPLMIMDADNIRIERLKKRLGARTKVQVLRSALDLLEKKTEDADKVARWKKAVALVKDSSREVNKGFQPYSLFKRYE